VGLSVDSFTFESYLLAFPQNSISTDSGIHDSRNRPNTKCQSARALKSTAKKITDVFASSRYADRSRSFPKAINWSVNRFIFFARQRFFYSTLAYDYLPFATRYVFHLLGSSVLVAFSIAMPCLFHF
jgi:hypothetical protein